MIDRAAADAYLIRHADQVCSTRRRDLLERYFARLDEGLLATQVETLGSFRPTAEDLRRHILPVLARIGDWERFLRYGLVACNLQRLSETLPAPAVRLLAESGLLGLAEELVSRLPRLADRLGARVELLSTALREGTSDRDGFGACLEGLRADLEEAPGSSDPEVIEALVLVAGELAGELAARWPRLLRRLEPAAADRIRLAAAECWLREGARGVEDAWSFLSAVSAREPLAEFLHRHREMLSAWSPAVLHRRLRSLRYADEALVWRALVVQLACRAERRLPAAQELADLPEALAPAALDVDSVLVAGPLWASLDGARQHQIEQGLSLECRAALFVALLADGGGANLAERARQALHSLPWGPERLRLELLLLRALPGATGRRDALDRIQERLAAGGCAASPELLALWLDGFAEAAPEQLDLRLQDLLWARDSTGETLLAVASAVQSWPALWAIARAAGESAVAVGRDDAEAFVLRGRVLGVVLRRAATEHGRIDAVERTRWLLPSEADELRAEIALLLWQQGERDGARDLLGRVRDAALRQRLQWLITERGQGLAALYGALASCEAVRDELDLLAALADPDLDPLGTTAGAVRGIRRPARRLLALLELARAEGRRPGGATTGLRLLKAELGPVESAEWLAALTPELLALAGTRDPGRLGAELKSATLRLLGLDDVAWEERRTLLASCWERGALLLAGRCRSARGRWQATSWMRWCRATLAGLAGAWGWEPERVADLERLLEHSVRHLPPRVRQRLGGAGGASAPGTSSTSVPAGPGTDLVRASATAAVDLEHPAHAGLRAKLRKPGGRRRLRPLALAVMEALDAGGAEAAETALRLWLHALAGAGGEGDRPSAAGITELFDRLQQRGALLDRLRRRAEQACSLGPPTAQSSASSSRSVARSR